MQYPASYYVIIGERSNGKTYSVKEYILEGIKQGKKFLYLRRTHAYITRRRMLKVFDDINDRALDELNSYIYYSTEQGFYINTDYGTKSVGYCTSIEDYMKEKGIAFDDISIVLFDEFIDNGYMRDEIKMFLNMMSTVARERTDLTVFMLGNTISKYCPYFDLFGIDIHKVKQGYIHKVDHKNGVTVVLEYCKNKVQELGKLKKNKYVGFDDNEDVKMILYGEWEYKETNIKNVDGIGWNSYRMQIPLYITALRQVYELSLNLKDGVLPIAFVRKVNTQDGKVKKTILYNLSYDKTVLLNSKKGVVPIVSRLTNLMDDNTLEMMRIFSECFNCSRIVFDTYQTGTEFSKAYTEIR